MANQSHAGVAAQRYARALFEAAQHQNALDQVTADMHLIGNVCAHPEVGGWLADPRVEDDRKQELLHREVGTKAHALTGRMLQVLGQRRRQGLLPEIPFAFQQILDAHSNQVRGVVESVKTLSDEQRAGLEQALAQRLGKNVTLESKANPELLGGVRVTLGSTRFDGSVRGRLDRLKLKLSGVDLDQDAN